MQGYNSYPQQQQPQQNSMQHPAHPVGVYAHQPQSPGAYGSQPTLPRYASTNSMQSHPGQPMGQQPMGMQQRQNGGNAYNGGQQQQYYNGPANGLNSRYSSYGYANGGPGAQGGAHPLSHALYADNSPSSPTLAGDHDEMDEKKGLASFPPSSSSSSGDSRSNTGIKGANSSNSNGNSKPAYKRWSQTLAGMGGSSDPNNPIDARPTRLERIGWLDGLRFLAAAIVLNATFFNATITNANSYSAIQRSSPLYIFRSFGLGLTMFLMILGRALSAPLWDIPASAATGASTTYGSTGAPTIAFSRLTRAMLTRIFRFILPVMVIAALIWALGATNATRDCNAAGMQQPYWNLIGRFAGWTTIIFNSFFYFEYLTSAAQTFTANLWTNAWFWQSSYAVYICHMMLGNLSSARYWIYGILAFFMWTTNNYFAVAIIGLTLTDIAVHGHFARMKKWPFMRLLAVQIVLIAVACALMFINVVRDNINKGMAVINIGDHDEIQFVDLIFVTCFFLVFETSSILQIIFGNIVMRWLGKLAPGMYLICPAIVFTLVPTLGVSLSNNGLSGSGILGTTWVVTFAISIVAAIVFYFAVEVPSKKAGELFANFVTHWGRSEDEKKAVKAPNAPAPKKISGPGGK